uniref:putative two-component response regulator ARR13 n=1 Tax=Erigeron canadensis TaxID=72917 RepID=UPI001CB93E09|nr:putative two-component response regulator ARR13 [Erigeron canadensis]
MVSSSNESKCSKTSLDSILNDEEGKEGSESKEVVELKDGGSSSNSTVEESDKKSCVRPYNRSKLPRLRWTNDLHLRFVQAVERLGGQDRATPKMVLQLMNVKGLHIAHVKSHLQMYRSKKFDDTCQAIGDQRIEGGDHNIYNLNQLPMLQCYNRTYDSSFRYEDTQLYRHNWMRNALREQYCSTEKTKPRFYNNMYADRILAINHMGQANHKFHTHEIPHNERNTSYRIHDINDKFRSRTCEKMEMLQGQYLNQLPNNTLKMNPFNIQENRKITLDLECNGLEKNKGVKRKAFDLNLDLNLSLGVNDQGNIESTTVNGDDGEGEQGNMLSLSLYPPSLSRIRNKIDHINDDDQKAKRASTLDLTI